MQSPTSLSTSSEAGEKTEAMNISHSIEGTEPPNDAQSLTVEDTPADRTQTQEVEESAEIADHTRKEHSEAGEEVELTPLQRLDRAAAWASENGSIVVGDSYNAVLGNTCHQLNMFEDATNYYVKVSADYADRHFVQIKHARCSLELKCFDMALEHARAGFDHLRLEADRNSLSETDMEYYLDSLKLFGDELVKAERYSDAIPFYEEALKRRPTDLLCRLKIIQLHCQLGDPQDVGYEILVQLTQDQTHSDGKALAVFLLENVTDYDYERTLSDLARTIRSDSMHALFISTIEEALQLAITHFDVPSQCILRTIQGQSLASRADPASKVKAASLWREIASIRLSDNDSNFWAVYSPVIEAARRWMKYESDQIRASILERTPLDDKCKEDWITNLRNMFDQATLSSSILRDTRGVVTIERYVISLYGMFNVDEARVMLKNDMASVLELLSDSDPENDSFALCLLARIFQSLGDKVGVLSALSLCDRPILKRRLKDENFGPNSEEWSSVEFSTISRSCDGCLKSMNSSDPDGLWWCPFCPGEEDWCAECKNGCPALIDRCSTDHVPFYFHLKHTNYSEEELDGTTVLVDWEYVEDDAGGYTRNGGRRIELAEWVEELRKQWGLPKPEGDGSRAQQ